MYGSNSSNSNNNNNNNDDDDDDKYVKSNVYYVISNEALSLTEFTNFQVDSYLNSGIDVWWWWWWFL